MQEFAEMDQAVGQGQGLQWDPNRLGEIGAGFDDDGDICCAGDVEPKLIALHAEQIFIAVPCNKSGS